ncbi:MAG: lectin [Burkholderiaceae bacterium]
MPSLHCITTKAAVTMSLALTLGSPMAADHPMSFFVTSKSIGQGGNLGGLEGADAHCDKLATDAGATKKTWRAYLSTQSPDGKARGLSARDRIGNGPWYNANGELIASDLDHLHINPNIVKRTALDETGNRIKGRGDKPNEHDILTGSKADGTAYFPWEEGDHTCSNWTSSEAGKGSAQVGHHDRHGGGNTSWNSTHGSRGCSQENLVSTGGAGLLYCFAAD